MTDEDSSAYDPTLNGYTDFIYKTDRSCGPKSFADANVVEVD